MIASETRRMIDKIYSIYRERIFPRVSSVRGTYRLKILFERLALKNIEKVDESPDDVFEKNWDNLLILDACRHDLYEEVEGGTDYRITKASNSPGFITQNFSEGDFSDVVYVTGNPFFSESKFEGLTGGRKPDEVFHEVFHTYMTDWDEEENTVLPGPLIRDAKTARNLFPEKRIVVHFMQPHYPFVNSNLTKDGIRPDLDSEKEGKSVWQEAERGEYSDEELWRGYRENLEFIIGDISDFSGQLEGRTVITSDHGNLVGEEDFYGHNFDTSLVPLRKVPWLKLD